jgi:hypothetical protein
MPKSPARLRNQPPSLGWARTIWQRQYLKTYDGFIVARRNGTQPEFLL